MKLAKPKLLIDPATNEAENLLPSPSPFPRPSPID